MAKFKMARWRGPIVNRRANGMGKIRFMILHIEEGTETGTDSWFHDPKAEASSHFGNPKIGPLDQFVDTVDEAWAQMAGNPVCISVEHEGKSGDHLTVSQIENDAQLLAWAHKTHGVRLRIANHPGSVLGGLGWHGMGGAAWGSHYDCPGKPIQEQRKAIVARAKAIVKAK